MAAATGLDAATFSVDAPPRRDLGDFAVGCFAAAKATGKNPAALAAEIAAGFTPNAWLRAATAAGPFVNFSVQRAAAFGFVANAAGAGLIPQTGTGATVCIDFSSPNISKHLAYHHIRSTVIGHAVGQILRAQGYRVIGINHLGDWGTTHGMLIAAAKLWGLPDPLDVTALNEMYVRFRKEMETNSELEGLARSWFKKLEDGDAEARALWQQFRDVSWAEFASVYAMLGITFDEVRGESAYEADMPRVLAEFRDKGLVSESEGAQVVELEGEKAPMLLVTRDGTTLYATRDIAAAQYRWNTYQFARSLYVVDRGQSMHFRQLWKALAKAGYAWANRCEHVPFGLVRIGGRKTGTRAGNVVLLKDVFREATEEIASRMEGSEVADVQTTAQKVGIGAVVFANLMSQRDKDVDFDWEKVMALDGDSGVYLQYTHARCASILRRAGATASGLEQFDATKLVTDAEWGVARRLLDYGDIVTRAGKNAEPHIVCHFLLELAGDFSRWYTAGNGDPAARILCEDAATRTARLALTVALQSTLAHGMTLLGLAPVDAV